MVANTPMQDDMVKAIRMWVKDLPPGVVAANEDQLEFEHVIRLTPTNPKGCSVEFRIGYHGTFGLYLGAGFAFEDITSSVSLGLDVCNTVRQGNVLEDVWEWRTKIIRTKGTVQLSVHPHLFDEGSTSWLGFLPLGRHRSIHYEAWCSHGKNGQSK